MASRHREEYVARKVWEEARAFQELFERTSGRSVSGSVDDIAREVKSKYDLTANQSARYDKIAHRLRLARETIDYLEQRFGVDDEGNIENPRELYLFAHKESAPKALVAAKSHGSSIELVMDDWSHENTLGTAERSSWGIYETIPPEELEPETSDGAEFSVPLLDEAETAKSLMISVPSLRIYIDNSREWNLMGYDRIGCYMPISVRAVLYRGKKYANEDANKSVAQEARDQTVQHELRHIQDNIMGNLRSIYEETPSRLVDGESLGEVIFFDSEERLDGWMDGIKILEDRIKKFENQCAPERILQNERERLRKNREAYEKDKSHFEKMSEIVDSLYKISPEDNRILSYVFSLSPHSKILRRIDCIGKNREELRIQDKPDLMENLRAAIESFAKK